MAKSSGKTEKGAASGGAASGGDPIASLGSAPVEQQEHCPHCTVGYPVPISGDENGTQYQCFACSYGYTVPADEALFAAELAKASADASYSKLAAIARRHGLDPAATPDTGDLHAAMVAAGKTG
ncbi:MAG TPA: hypothetical protein VGJ25_09990 [Gaiellaceae bacterium]